MKHHLYDFIPASLALELKIKKVPHGYDYWVDPEETLKKEQAKLEMAQEELAKAKTELAEIKASQEVVQAKKLGRPKKVS